MKSSPKESNHTQSNPTGLAPLDSGLCTISGRNFNTAKEPEEVVQRPASHRGKPGGVAFYKTEGPLNPSPLPAEPGRGDRREATANYISSLPTDLSSARFTAVRAS